MLGSQSSLSKSKQLYHLELEGGRCELAKPDKRLDQFIDYYWMLTIEKPSLVLEVIPDTAVDLVLSPDIQDFAALYFPTVKKFYIDLEGPIQYAGICCRSETASDLLRLDFSTLTQLEVGADTREALEIAPLMDDIQGTNSLDNLVERFDRFWLARLEQDKNEKVKKNRISHQDMIATLENTLGSGSVADICEKIGVSERQFRRISNDHFGLSPKKLQRILRLQAALDELFRTDTKQRRDLYYDDSHRIKELKSLTGWTPEYIRKMAEKYNTP